MGIKDFLNHPKIKQLIAEGNLEAVYESYPLENKRNAISRYLLSLGINPVKYFTDLIPDAACWNCQNLTTVNILDSVTKIGRGAFAVCAGLKDVTIGNNVTDIGPEAFQICTNLKSITIPDKVTVIGRHAFYACDKMTSVIFGENSQLLSIGESVFSQCTNLASINLPDSVNVIGNYAFEGCASLTDVYYKGTMEQWKNINKYKNWRFGSSINTIHCNDGDIHFHG